MKLWRYLFLLAAPLIPIAADRVDESLGPYRSQEEILYLQSGQAIKRLSPGFEDLMADLYWLRTVQYYGSQKAFATEKRFDLLLPLIEITTTLDPRLEIAYRYGAVFLCEPWPVGKGDPQAGIRVLEKGVRALPLSWRIRQDLGYFRYIFLDDAQGGAKVLLEGGELPGAPFWMKTLAAAILAKGADRQTARMVWQHLYAQEEAALKENALYNLKRLDALDVIDALNAVARRYSERHGHPPTSIPALLAEERVDRRLLVDPDGMPFAYDASSGSFWFARPSRFWRSRLSAPSPGGSRVQSGGR